jgi:hypothetical protein
MAALPPWLSSRRCFKALLQVAGARTGKALIEAVGRALDALAAKDTAHGFFECRGYRAKIHLL